MLTYHVPVTQGLLKLTHLEELDISHNRMKLMPDDFGCLNKLMRLDLSNNELVNFPQDRVDVLASLLELDVSNNHIDQMPMGFPYLYRLKVRTEDCLTVVSYEKCLNFVLEPGWPDFGQRRLDCGLGLGATGVTILHQTAIAKNNGPLFML